MTATADTVGSYHMVFPVVDKFSPPGFNTKTGCSTGFSKNLQEGKRKVSSELTFDYAGGQAERVQQEPGEGHLEAAEREYSGVRGGYALGDLLRGFAAAGRWGRR